MKDIKYVELKDDEMVFDGCFYKTVGGEDFHGPTMGWNCSVLHFKKINVGMKIYKKVTKLKIG